MTDINLVRVCLVLSVKISKHNDVYMCEVALVRSSQVTSGDTGLVNRALKCDCAGLTCFILVQLVRLISFYGTEFHCSSCIIDVCRGLFLLKLWHMVMQTRGCSFQQVCSEPQESTTPLSDLHFELVEMGKGVQTYKRALSFIKKWGEYYIFNFGSFIN